MGKLNPRNRRRQSRGDPELLGLREVVMDSPWGLWRVQFWLTRRPDGGPHTQLIAQTVMCGRPEEHLDYWDDVDGERVLEQVAWLSEHREELYGRMRAMVEAEWPDHERRRRPGQGTLFS